MLREGEWTRARGCATGSCVEVTLNPAVPGKVFVRNSQDRRGPVVAFTEAEWEAFLGGAVAGEFDLP